MKVPIVSAAYQGRSLNIAADRMVNFYCEVEPGDAKTPAALIGTPGSTLWASLSTGPIRGMYAFNGSLYTVSGDGLYSISTGAVVSSKLGTLSTTTGRVQIVDNGLTSAGAGGNQLALIDSDYGYTYNVNTGTFAAISGGGWPSSGMESICYIDGYFIGAIKGSMTVGASDLFDGTTWNALATSPVSAASDLVKIVANLSQQLWIIKEYSSEAWYDAGVATSSGFPFRRMSGAVFNYGTTAPASAAIGGDSLFFLATQRQGNAGELVGVAQIAAQTYQPQLVTPPAILYQWNQYATTTDAFAYCYTSEGHTFYVITFPIANATWAYDVSTQLWHERSTYVGSPYRIIRHFSNCYAYFAGKHLVGDYQAGNIYELRSDVYADGSLPLVSMRICPHLADKDDNKNVFIRRLEIDLEGGVGSTSTGSDPQIGLSWSDDGGHSWSNQYTTSMGKVGEFKTRAVFRRLGYGRDRVFRITISEDCKRILLSSFAS